MCTSTNLEHVSGTSTVGGRWDPMAEGTPCPPSSVDRASSDATRLKIAAEADLALFVQSEPLRVEGGMCACTSANLS